MADLPAVTSPQSPVPNVPPAPASLLAPVTDNSIGETPKKGTGKHNKPILKKPASAAPTGSRLAKLGKASAKAEATGKKKKVAKMASSWQKDAAAAAVSNTDGNNGAKKQKMGSKAFFKPLMPGAHRSRLATLRQSMMMMMKRMKRMIYHSLLLKMSINMFQLKDRKKQMNLVL